MIRNKFSKSNTSEFESIKRFDNYDNSFNWTIGDNWPDVGEYSNKSVAGVVMPATDSYYPEILATTMSDGGTITNVEYVGADIPTSSYYGIDGHFIGKSLPTTAGIYIELNVNGVTKKHIVR